LVEELESKIKILKKEKNIELEKLRRELLEIERKNATQMATV